MIKRLIIILAMSSITIASDGKWFTSKNTSFGIGDEKFGLDFFSFSRTIYEQGNDEIFVGFGTSIFISTQAGIGWKRTFDTDKKFKPFLSASMFDRGANKMAVTNGDATREDNCISFAGGGTIKLFDRKEGKRDVYFNIGAILVNDFRNSAQVYPIFNIEFKN